MARPVDDHGSVIRAATASMSELIGASRCSILDARRPLPGAPQALRRRRRRGRPRPRGARRRVLRPARPQRRGQDDDHRDPRGAARAGRGRRGSARPALGRRRIGAAAAARHPAAGDAAQREAVGRGSRPAVPLVLPPRAERRRRARDGGTRVEAEGWVGKLSGGQKQRLAVACALVNQPDLLFLDEPTTGLDPQSRRQLWALLERFRRSGGTIVITTHYMDEAETLCDRVAVDGPGPRDRARHAARARGVARRRARDRVRGAGRGRHHRPTSLAVLPGVQKARVEDGHLCLNVVEPARRHPGAARRTAAGAARRCPDSRLTRRRSRTCSLPSPGGICAMSDNGGARHPLLELTLARLREFIREPEAVFWVFCFPILLAFGLGIAFRNQGDAPVHAGRAGGRRQPRWSCRRCGRRPPSACGCSRGARRTRRCATAPSKSWSSPGDPPTYRLRSHPAREPRRAAGRRRRAAAGARSNRCVCARRSSGWRSSARATSTG